MTQYSAVILDTEKPSQEVLKALLHYEPIKGVFTWKISPGNTVPVGTIAGAISGHGYREIMYKGKSYKASHLALVYMTGRWPEEVMDHINGIRDDDRWENLRECSWAENTRNRNMPNTNTSGIKGVSFYASENKWRGNVTVNGKRYMKRFDTAKEAEEWCKQTRMSLHRNFTNSGEI